MSQLIAILARCSKCGVTETVYGVINLKQLYHILRRRDWVMDNTGKVCPLCAKKEKNL